MQKKKLLIVVTSHETLGATGRPTGYYLSEVTRPFFAFLAHGIPIDAIDIASVKGGKAPMDPDSRNPNDPINQRFLDRPELIAKLNRTLHPDDLQPDDYGAIFFAGGHGAMWDFPGATTLMGLTTHIYEQQQGIVGAVCHGPAALINVQLSDGTYLVAGKTVAAFTDDEERTMDLDTVVPFLLSSILAQRGATLQHAPRWAQNVAVSERLVTGQNPASATGTGEAVARLMQQQHETKETPTQ